MLSPNLLSDDQLKLIDRLYENDITLVYAKMGFGKSICLLSAVVDLLADKVCKRVLIVAPLKPCKTVWGVEHKLWTHTEHLKVALAIGTPKERKAAIISDADIVVINIENLVWLLNEYKNLPFECLVLDEISKYKANSSKVVKKLRYRTKEFKIRIGLTGTPVNESLTGLFSQVLVLDGGARFGRNYKLWLMAHFFSTDYEERNWEIRDGQLKPMMDKIKGILYAVPDYTHQLKPLVEAHQYFGLSDGVLAEYNQFKRDSVFNCFNGTVVAESAAVLTGKLQQFSSGFLYVGAEKKVYDIHTRRLDALTDYLVQPLNQGQNIVIFYHFEADKQRLINYFEGEAVLLDGEDTEAAWCRGDVRILLAHPLSASHGLNLQSGGCRLLFYTPLFSNDQKKQAIARLWRRNQTEVVVSTTLVCRDTIDEIIEARIEDKEMYDLIFRQHCKGV